MTTLIVTVFLSSLLGSLHCAGMCGPFVAICVGPDEPGTGPALRAAAYHGGRLLGYTLLGVAAGLAGTVVDLGAGAFGLRAAAMTAAGAAMVVFGVVALLRLGGVRIAAPGVPRPLVGLFRRGEALARRRHPVTRAGIIGLLAILLPCGWLYAFVIVAAGTASPGLGVLTMIVFWLGTVPILVAVGVGVQTLLGPLRRHLPAAMALLMIVAGGLVAVRSFAIDPSGFAGRDAVALPAAGADTDLRALVPSIDQSTLPCCPDDE